MRRLLLIWLCTILPLTMLKAQFYSINNDPVTISAMQSFYPEAFNMEQNISSAWKEILEHYRKAGLSSSGIFASKYLERKALKNAGRFSDAQRNYYYKRISQLVAREIMPRIIRVAGLCLQYPERALFWGSYLYKTTEDVKNLCMQFETIVCNGTITFKDLVFFCISDEFKKYFDLAQLGDVDWSTMFDNLGDFVGGLSTDDIYKDIKDILQSSWQIGGGLASASGDMFNMALDSVSSAGKKTFSFKLKEMKKGFKEFKNIYKDFQDGSKLKDELVSRLGSNDSLALTRLFQIDNYNTTRYLMQFWDQFRGQYYKQRYYIYSKDEGEEVLCNYVPPTSPDEEITDGREWTRFKTNQQSMKLTASQMKTAQSNSERYAGWSEVQVKNMNSSPDKGKYTYEFYKSMMRYYITQGGNVISNAVAFQISVRRWWSVVEEVYEEVFDSYNMDLNAFLAKMNGKVNEYNTTQIQKQNSNGQTIEVEASNPKKYYLGCDEKLYYEESDDNKLKGCESVEFIQECHESNKYSEATFSWKENGKHNHTDVRNDTREYAMSSNAGDCSTSELEDELARMQKEIDRLSDEIKQVESEINTLESKLGSCEESEKASLQTQLSDAKNRRSTLQSQKKNVESQLQEGQSNLITLENDCADELDGPYRIPDAMLECERAFDIRWNDEGSWSGNQFIRHGSLKSLQGKSETEVVFTATLSVTRGEKHFLGIRVHRAIIKCSWNLVGNHTFKETIEVMPLDPTANESSQSQKVNQRLHELQKANPSCVVTLEYHYQEEVEKDTEDSLHLLWASDRLALAREIEYRLAVIAADLMQNEKFLRIHLNLKDYLIHQLFDGLPDGSKSRFGGLAYRRWRSAARQIAQGTKPQEIEIEQE